METSKLKLIAEFTNGRAVGPGKIQLLEAIEKAGSISQASRNLGMSYRHAWMLVDDMNKCFRNPVIEARPGAPQGGHATLTPLGKKLIEQYRAIEAAAWLATSKHIHEIEAFLNTSTVSRPTTSIKRSLRTAAA